VIFQSDNKKKKENPFQASFQFPMFPPIKEGKNAVLQFGNLLGSVKQREMHPFGYEPSFQ